MKGEWGIKIHEQGFVLAEEAAEKMNITKQTLSNWRFKGYGPPFYVCNGKIVYKLSDVETFNPVFGPFTKTARKTNDNP